MTLETRILNVEGMTCNGCVKSVHNAVESLEGVKTVSVDLENNLATATFELDKLTAEDIAGAISEAGFEAKVANS